MLEFDQLFEDVEKSVALLKGSSEKDDELQSGVCLTTRSAYTHFHAISAIEGGIDSSTADRLRELLELALAALPGGKYRESVEFRLDEFRAFCKDLESCGTENTSLVYH